MSRRRRNDGPSDGQHPHAGKNNKLKPNVVVVDGRQKMHPEGMYYLNVDSHWEKAGATAVEAREAQRKRFWSSFADALIKQPCRFAPETEM